MDKTMQNENKYRQRGWMVIPIPKGEKGPKISEWQKLRLSEGDLPKYFGADSNVGVLLGEPSGGLVDIDLDRPEAAMLTSMILPPTGAVFGRPSKPGSHYLYRVTDSIKTKKFTLPPGWVREGEQDTVVEIRSTGSQTVFPGSVHPSGEIIRWDKEGEPAEISREELEVLVQELFDKSLKVYVIESALSAISPDNYDTWLKVGMALRYWQEANGWEQDICFQIWNRWSRKSSKYNGEEMQAKWDSFKSNDADNGNTVTLGTLFHFAFENGWQKLPDQDRHVDWSMDEGVHDDVVLDYNKNNAVVLASGKCVVIREDLDPVTGQPEVIFCSPNDFHNYYASAPRVRVNGQDKFSSRVWFSHPKRRTYKNIVFDPSGKASGDYYNMWNGFAVDAVPGDWSLMQQHMLKVICQNDTARFQYLMAWMARIVQQPGGDRPGVAVVLCGGQGTGKGIFVRHFGSIFGRHFLHLTNQKALTGDYNDHFKDAVVVFADESFFAGDKASVGQLKGLITETTNSIHPKYVNRFTVANHVNLIMASNEKWVVPAEEDERRFFVMDVSEERKKDHEYFANLHKCMRSGGTAAMLYDLLRYDLREVNLRNFPKTDALMGQKLRNLDSVGRWWFDCLYTENILNNDGVTTGLSGEDTTELFGQPLKKSQIYSSYLQHCQKVKGGGYPESSSGFFKQWKKYNPYSDEKRIQGERCVVVRSLAECRTGFEIALGGKIAWDDLDGTPEAIGESAKQLKKRAKIKALPGKPIEEGMDNAA